MPSYTSTTKLKRIQYDPAEDGSVRVEAFFEDTVTNDSDPLDVSVSPWEVFDFKLPPEIASQIFSLASSARASKQAGVQT